MAPVKSVMARTHSEALKAVCAACWRKKGSMRGVTDQLEALIIKYIFDGYNKDNGVHPCFICDICRITLREQEV